MRRKIRASKKVTLRHRNAAFFRSLLGSGNVSGKVVHALFVSSRVGNRRVLQLVSCLSDYALNRWRGVALDGFSLSVYRKRTS